MQRDIRIRSRMMVILGVLKGRPTKTAPGFADAAGARCSCGWPGSTEAALVASGTLSGRAGFHAQGTGGSDDLSTGFDRNCSPRERFETGYAAGCMPDTARAACAGSYDPKGEYPVGNLNHIQS